MQYLRGGIYNSVKDCTRHMHMAAEKHMDAILRVLKYCYDCPNRGLKLKPNVKWDGSWDFEFTVDSRPASDYAKDLQTCKSLSGGRVLLNGAPVTFWSSTQKTVALSVTEVELYVAVLCAQALVMVIASWRLLFCIFLKQKYKVHGGTAEQVKLIPIAKAHALLWHHNEAMARRTAKALGWTISRGLMKPCKACTISKAK